MEYWRKILIIIILTILLYVLLRLVLRRIQILNQPESTLGGIREGLTSSAFTDSYVISLQSANTTSITAMKPFSKTNLTSKNGITNIATALQLKQYCIKSSFNTAYNGTNVSLDMIKYVLSRGCRFLDFEVYYQKPTPIDTVNVIAGSSTLQACVSWSLDPYIPSTNLIALGEVFNTIIMNGYSTNVSDPIFIQLRAKVETPNTAQNSEETIVPDNRRLLYNSIANSVTPLLDPFRYAGKIKSDIQLVELCGSMDPSSQVDQNKKGKIVIIMDTVNNPAYAQLSPALEDVVNIDNNSSIMKTYTPASLENMKEAPVVPNKDNYTMNIVNSKQVIPVDGKNQVYGSNLDYVKFVTQYSCQITPMLFYSNDSYLVNYEKMFNDLGCSIVALTQASPVAKATKVNAKSVFP